MKKRFFLRRKLIVFMGIMFCMVIIIQLAVTFYYFNIIIINKTKDLFSETIAQVSERLEGNVKANNDFVSLIANNSTIAHYLYDINKERRNVTLISGDIKEEVLKLKPGKIPYLTDVYIISLTDVLINCYFSTEVMEEIDPYSQLIMSDLDPSTNKGTIWDDIYLEKEYISSYTPIYLNNIPVGLVRIRFEKSLFGDIVDDIGRDSKNTILILNDRNIIIYSNNSDLIGLSRNEVSTAESFIFEQSINNKVWTIVGIVSNQYAFSEINKLVFIFVCLNIIVFIFVIIVVIIYINRVLEPLKNIVKGMKQVQEGDLNVEVIADKTNELYYIADNFNYMMNRINSLVNQIYKYQIASKKADMIALEAKLNPHFLYNTLDTIYWLLMMRENNFEADMVFKLTDILRYSISHQDEFVPLGEDMAQIENYIVLQRCRFKDELSYSIDISNDILDIMIPKLLIQPIVENAIIHGFHQFIRNGLLEIRGFSEDSDVYIIVKDNGVGFSANLASSISKDGFGLKITNERIKNAYGQEYGIEINSKPQKGTEVIIRIGRYPKVNLSKPALI